MDRIDIMVDLETLGVGEDPPLLQITAIPFDLTDDGIDITDKGVNYFVDIGSATNISGSTLKWWLNTDKELLAKLVNGDGKLSIPEKETLHLFCENIECLKQKFKVEDKNIYLWGNGILFDNRIISAKCKKYGMNYPIYYRNDRDVRTINELAALKLGMSSAEEFRKSIENTGTPHNARDDVLYQIKCVQKAYKVLMGEREDFWN